MEQRLRLGTLGVVKYAFRYDGLGGAIVRAVAMGPRFSSIEVTDTTLRVCMGWGFRATVPRASITSVATDPRRMFSRGAHGWRGRWLVNGSGKGLVTITIDPPTRGFVIGFPIRLRTLTVSAATPTELITALAATMPTA